MTNVQFQQIEQICEGMETYAWSAQRTGRNTFEILGQSDHGLCTHNDSKELENDANQQIMNWSNMAKQYGWQIVTMVRNDEYGTVAKFKF